MNSSVFLTIWYILWLAIMCYEIAEHKNYIKQLEIRVGILESNNNGS